MIKNHKKILSRAYEIREGLVHVKPGKLHARSVYRCEILATGALAWHPKVCACREQENPCSLFQDIAKCKRHKLWTEHAQCTISDKY